MELALPYVIETTCVTAPVAKRRLNALEAVIADIANPWRPTSPVVPSRDLRMAELTRRQLLEWIDVDGAEDDPTIARLEQYTSESVADESVQPGWIRVLLSLVDNFDRH